MQRVETLETGVTHTQRADIGAPEIYYSHLTSLRKKGKEKTERASEEGKRER